MAHRCAAHAWRAIRARPTGAKGLRCRQPLRSACARSGLTPISRSVRWRVCRVGVGPTRSRFDGRPQWHSVPASHGMIWMGAASPPSCGVAGVRGRQRSAISMSAWDGPSRRAAHAQTGPGVRSERCICGRVRRAAESRRTAAARSGIIGWTIRDPSCLPLDGRIRRIRGQTSAVKPCVCSAANGLRLRRRDGDALGRFVRSAFGRVFGASWPGAICWLESDLRSGQRREHRPNIPALVLRRFVASGRVRRPFTTNVCLLLDPPPRVAFFDPPQ